MGTGTDVAIESAGVTLLKGDLTGIVRARRLSQATMRNIRQNLFFAFIYNAAGVPIAAGVLYPVFGILLSPIIAAAAMALSSVSVVGNALRLRRVRLEIPRDARAPAGCNSSIRYLCPFAPLPHRGSMIDARKPPVGRLRSVNSPPCACTVESAIAKPKPVPPVSRLRDASTR
jgi:hypothetical protein